MTGLSLGGMVLVPLAAYLTSILGTSEIALPILGAPSLGLVVIPIAIWVIKQRPSDVGQFRTGTGSHTLSPGYGRASRTRYASQWRIWTRAEALRTAAFWAIVTAFMLALSGQIAFLVHQVSFLSQTLGPKGAALAVSVTAGASIIGRLVPGIDRRPLRQAVPGHGLFFYSGGGRPLYGLFPFGGGPLPRDLGLWSDHGRDRYAAAAAHRRVLRAGLLRHDNGFGRSFFRSGAAFGPLIAGLIYDATRDYRIAFTIFAAASLLAMVAVLFARPPQVNR